MIVVGAPVHQRAWILPSWFDHLAAQDNSSELTIVLNYGPGDDETLDVIQRESRFEQIVVIESEGLEHHANRDWGLERFDVMAQLRNDLLAVVRNLRPDFFLSCDTDILLPPGALTHLLQESGQWDGIAPLTHMSPYADCPNWLTKDLKRFPSPDVVTDSYAVFGVVLMKPSLYAIDYSTHPWGEDLGWAESAHKAGLRLALDPRVRAKHVMRPDMLHTIDERVGF